MVRSWLIYGSIMVQLGLHCSCCNIVIAKLLERVRYPIGVMFPLFFLSRRLYSLLFVRLEKTCSM